MTDYRELLETRYHLDLGSVTRALTSFNHKLDDDRARKHTVCNRLIADLGCTTVDHPVDAETFAKTLIEQVILNGLDYVPALAAIAARQRVAKIKQKMPELYVGADIEIVGLNGEVSIKRPIKKVKRAGREGSGDKKDNAFKIYTQHKDKPTGDIARLIAAELQITYANAHYYVSRVFKK